MICENCKEDHDGSYGSGRFCGKKCARGFSTKLKREEINEKVSKKIGQYSKETSCEEIEDAIKKTRSMAEASKMINIPYTSFKRLAKKYGLYTPVGVGWRKDLSIKTDNRIKSRAIDLKKIMIENSTYSRRSLKKRLLDNGIKQNKCEICDFEGLWNDKPVIMILDHINGINNDHRLENLRMVCPMCNTQLDTFTGRNCKNKKPK